MVSGRKLAGVVAVLGVLAAVTGALSVRAWSSSHPRAYVVWAVLALVALAALLVLVLPGSAVRRVVAVTAAAVVVAGVLGWTTVVQPRGDVDAAFDGDAVAWSRAIGDDDTIGEITLLSPERAVVRRGTELHVIDTRTGEDVATQTIGSRATVTRTVDGFAVQDDQRFAIHDRDGGELTRVNGDVLVSRGPGVTVVYSCGSGPCSVDASSDDGEALWSETGYDRPAPVRQSDGGPPGWGSDAIAVAPVEAVLPRRGESAGGQQVFDVLDPTTGEPRTTIEADVAGAVLGTDDTSRIVSVATPRRSDECVVSVLEGDDRTDFERQPECAGAFLALGDRLLADLPESPTTPVFDLTTGTVSQLSPPADLDVERPPLVQQVGTGGYALPRTWFDRTTARSDDTSVSGGAWGTDAADRWRFDAGADVRNVTVGASSVAVTSDVVPLNAWDDPADAERVVTVVGLDDGRPTGSLRLRSRVDSATGLPDGSFLVAIEGGRLVRLG